ncbi:hypothetical protein GPL15_25500 [Clostridium sp. MCC353]|uniref:DUF6449 domain-containing protein n=1 Tax=Clostridium sp. MCC353 TaxID=2592646 RepID=UPI001C02A18C|nr:DUF6449 domain-containing protein [Clostridium sp. MCC353]MBT9779831.1 hypothetical protein [Clostridium sp. MCC353]
MTSKNLFFKLSYEDIKGRLWTLALVMLFFLFTFPVAAVYLAGENREYYDAAEWLQWYQNDIINLISARNGFLCFMFIVLAIVCGMTSFSYLNFKNKVDFYHSIPVKREKIYFANFMNGIWMIALPYALFLSAGILIAVSNGVEFLPLLSEGAKGYAMHMTYYLLAYATVVVVMMLTGNRVVGFMGVLTFFSYVPLAASVIEGCFYTWFWTYAPENSFLRQVLQDFSPVTAYTRSVSQYESDGIILWRIIAALGAFVVLMALGLILYKKRPSEAAGKAMAFPVTKPVIRILIVMFCSLSMMLFGWGLRKSMGWAVFCMLCGCIIAHCVIEVIYNFDFKQLFGHKLQLLGCIAASLLVLIVFRYDIFGYDKYLPDAGNISHVSVGLNGVDNWVDYGSIVPVDGDIYKWNRESGDDYREKHMKITDPGAALELAQAGIDRNNRLKAESVPSSRSYYIDSKEDAGQVYTEVLIKYYLKGNRTAVRSYYIPLNAAEDGFKRLYGSREYKDGNYPILNQTGEETSSVIYKKNNNKGKESRLAGNSQGQAASILQAYQEEWMNTEMETRRMETPVGIIRFVTKDEEPTLEWARRQALVNNYQYYYNTISEVEYYPVYPSFEKTLGLLKEYGLDVKDTLEGFTPESAAVWKRYGGNEEKIVFSDPEQVKEILKHAVLMENSEYNSFTSLDYNLDLSIRFVNQGITQEYQYLFKTGQIPEFVTQRVGE